jgi:ATP-grasp domain, R2K clade family 3
MQWLVEQMGIARMPGAPDDNDDKIMRVLRETSRPFYEIKQVPFTEELIIDHRVDITKPTLIYGSTQIIEKVFRRTGHKIETFFNCSWWDPFEWKCRRSDMLNQDPWITTVAYLRDNWVTEPTFVKSMKVKALTGMVIYPDKHDRDCWLIEHSELDGDDALVMASPVNIENEWRFFIIDGQIITGSMYRMDGHRRINPPISLETRQAVDEMIKGWMPNKNIVMDVAKLRTGEYKVIEFNGLAASGFYSSNVLDIIEAMEQVTKNKYLMNSTPKLHD